MKLTIALLTLVALVAVSNSSVIRSSARANLIVGGISSGDRILHRSYVYRPTLANTIQYEDVLYRGNATNRITAIQATEIGASQFASAQITYGGIGWNTVTIRFTSYRGYGYYYLLDIWGH